jgi:hypothetical protein
VSTVAGVSSARAKNPGDFQLRSHNDGYRAQDDEGYAPPQNASGSRRPLAVFAGAGARLNGARGRGLGLGEQLVKAATQHPHAAADAQRRQRSLGRSII